MSSSLPWWAGFETRDFDTRLSKSQRLELLQIDESEFQLYKDIFTQDRKKFGYSIQMPDGGWPQVSRTASDSQILRHICSELNIAIPYASMVGQIMVDIDFKGNRPWSEVESTASAVIGSIPGDPLVYQSSQSEGIRILYFMNQKVDRRTLCNYTTAKFREAGIDIGLGKCEVRLGTGPDRLPFGAYSMLLDPIMLEPIYHLSLLETLRIVRSHRDLCAIDSYSEDMALGIASTNDFNVLIDNLLLHGLPPHLTSTECLQKLAWHYRARLGLNDFDNCQFLRNWITMKHNGNSTRMNRGQSEDLYRQLDRIVAGLKVVRREAACTPVVRLGLTAEELRVLADLPCGLKVIKGFYLILCFAKSKLLEDIKTQERQTEERGGTNKWGRDFEGTEVLPNRAGNFTLSIDLGKKRLRHLGVPYSDNPSRLVSELEALGILKLKRKAWPDGGKPRQFWVNFPFDIAGETLSVEFDVALWEVLGFEGIKRRFTPYQAKRIKSKVTGIERKEVYGTGKKSGTESDLRSALRSKAI